MKRENCPGGAEMDFFRIRCFLAAAEFNSITRAAEYMNITQPAMSFQIRELEKELGVKVFSRENKSLSLTPAGNVLKSGFSQMLQSYRILVDAAKTVSGSRNRLTVGYHGPVGWAGVPEFVSDFSKEHDNAEVVIYQQNWKELADFLRSGAIDVAFLSIEEVPTGKDYSSISLFTESTGFAISPRHRLAGKSSVTIDDVRDETVFMNNHPSACMDAIVERLLRSGIRKENVSFFEQMDMTLAMAASNQGIASIPKSFGTENSALKYIEYDSPACWLSYSLVSNNALGNPLTPVFMSAAQKVSWPYGSSQQ